MSPASRSSASTIPQRRTRSSSSAAKPCRPTSSWTRSSVAPDGPWRWSAFRPRPCVRSAPRRPIPWSTASPRSCWATLKATKSISGAPASCTFPSARYARWSLVRYSTSVTQAYDVEALRRTEFPWATRGDRVYLNHASTGPLPARTLRALATWAEWRGEPWRISDDMEFDVMDRTRALAAQLLGATADEIALTTNTSHGINIAARCLPLRAGDVVLSSDREFPANVYPWMALAREGINYERIPCTSSGLPDEQAILDALDRRRVKVLTLSWVSFATGFTFDLERMGRACRERDIYFVVDAIQGVGVRPLDVHRCHIDILACGGQKWLLSPWGSGFAYVRRDLVGKLEP